MNKDDFLKLLHKAIKPKKEPLGSTKPEPKEPQKQEPPKPENYNERQTR